jgi:hypothetical protein
MGTGTGKCVSIVSKNMFQTDTYTYLDAHAFSMLIPPNMKSILYTIYNLSSQIILCSCLQ